MKGSRVGATTVLPLALLVLGLACAEGTQPAGVTQQNERAFDRHRRSRDRPDLVGPIPAPSPPPRGAGPSPPREMAGTTSLQVATAGSGD